MVDDVYRIEKVLDHRTRRGVKESLVKWLGYPETAASWVKDSELKDI